MMKLSIVLVFVALLALHAAPAQAYGGCDSQDSSYDYLLLVTQWPGAYNIPGDYFTLHGLWPSRNGSNGDDATSYPCYCSDDSFDVSKVQSILTPLEKYWASLVGDDYSADVKFWTHEYEKHGTCATDVQALNTEFAFMKTTLSLRQEMGFYQVLSDAGISPGSSFSPDDYSNAIKSRFGVAPLLCCDNNNNLNGIAVCMDRGFTPQECSEQVKSHSSDVNNCDLSNAIYFPSSSSLASNVARTTLA